MRPLTRLFYHPAPYPFEGSSRRVLRRIFVSFLNVFSSKATLENGRIEVRTGQEIGTDGPHVLRTRSECKATSLWSQVIGQDRKSVEARSLLLLSCCACLLSDFAQKDAKLMRVRLLRRRGNETPTARNCENANWRPMVGGKRKHDLNTLNLTDAAERRDARLGS